MVKFEWEENLDLLITCGFDAYVLYLSVDLFKKIKDRKETILELDTLRNTIYVVLGLNIFLLVTELAYLLKSKEKMMIDLFTLTLIDLILTITYIIILQKLEDFYKDKNYDKSTQYAKILIGVDSCSILVSLVGAILPSLKKL